MSYMDSDRFHRAARDGYLDLLQEANRKELNSRDEDGMTPAMWAAYYGHLDALRLIVGRGGDPDKCDHYGNTSLHCASGNGHTDCVSFLVNFGVNLWSLDNDFHTAKDVAVLNRRDDALRLLDQAQSKHALVNKKLVQRLKEKSVYDAEKRVKHYRKMQQKAAKRAEKEEKERMAQQSSGDGIRLSLPSFRKDSKSNYAPKFSDIVNSGDKRETIINPKRSSRKKTVVFRPGHIIRREDDDPTSFLTRRTTSSDSTKGSDDGGTSSPDHPNSSDDANSDVLQTADSGIGDDLQDPSSPPSGIFERPGFGTVAFRRGVVVVPDRKVVHLDSSTINDSIGSASSLAMRRHITWEDECEAYHDADDDETEDEEEDQSDPSDVDEDEGSSSDPLSLLLASVGLSDYLPLFQSERIDLEALSLLSEEDLKAVGMPLGPRRKLGKAVQERMKILQEPGVVLDSAL